MAVRKFGGLLKSRREESVDPVTGKPYTQARIAELISEITGEPISRSLVAGWESGEIAVPQPGHINALARILPISVLEAVTALGFDVESLPLREDEQDLLGAYRRLRTSPLLREAALRILKAMPESLPRRGGQRQLRAAENRPEYRA